MPTRPKPFESFEFRVVEASDFGPEAEDDHSAYLLAIADGQFVGYIHYEDEDYSYPEYSVFVSRMETLVGYGYLRRGVATELLFELRSMYSDREPEDFVVDVFMHVGATKAWANVFGQDHPALLDLGDVPKASKAYDNDWGMEMWYMEDASARRCTLRVDGEIKASIDVVFTDDQTLVTDAWADGRRNERYVGALIESFAEDRAQSVVIDPACSLAKRSLPLSDGPGFGMG